MKLIITIVLIAGFGIYAGWWTSSQVTDAGTQVVSAGTSVANAVGEAIKENATPKPTTK